MTSPSTQWYAVYTHTRTERWARSNLWERGFEVYLPEYLKERRHAPIGSMRRCFRVICLSPPIRSLPAGVPSTPPLAWLVWLALASGRA